MPTLNPKRPPKLTRRQMLGGLGASALLFPFARSVRAQTPPPKRLIVVFTANGTIRESWLPQGGETDFSLSPILAPLAEHRDDMLILDGLRLTVGGQGNAHHHGFCCNLTGTEMVPGPFLDGNNELYGYHGDITIDQYIARELAAPTPFPTLEIGVQADAQYADTSLSKLSALGPAQLVPPENDPFRLFDRVFANVGPGTPTTAQLRAQRLSVLDFVKGDLSRLKTKLGAADRTRLDAHLESVRGIERRLQKPGVAPPGCALPETGATFDVRAEENFPLVGRLQTDLLVAALACDQTRIATFMWSQGVSRTVYSWLGHPSAEDHHELSHKGDSDQDAKSKLTQINTWLAGEIAYLIGRLKAIPEGNGTLFDNTLILWTNDLSKGNNHQHNPIPYVLFGGGGYFRTGRFLNFGGRYHNDLLVSVANAMGVQTNCFGKAQNCRGALPGLV